MDLARQLDHFHQQVVHRLGRDDQAGVFQLGAVAVVELVAVPVALGHHVLAVQLAGQGARLEPLLLQAQAHGAAQVRLFVALFDLAAVGAPLGDQPDHRMLALLVVLGAVGAFQAGLVAGVVDHRRLHAVADAEVRHAVLARELRGHHLALETTVAESARHQDAVDVAEQGLRALLHVLGLQPLQVDPGALAQAAMLERLAHRLVGVLVVHVLADDGDGDLVDRMHGRIDRRLPFRKVGRAGHRQAQAVGDQGVQALRVQLDRQLVQHVHVLHRDHRALGNVGEQGDLAPLAIGQRLLAAAQQHVGLDADRTQLLDRVLGRLGLQLARGGDPRHQGEVHEQRLVRPALGADLADRLEERQRLDVADRAADLDQGHVEALRGLVDAALDLVGDVRDHLHGRAEVVAAAFLADHAFVDAAGGDRVPAAQARAHEALVVAQVQVGLGAVVGDVHLAVLERAHRARIDVDVGVQLHHRDLQATGFEDGRKRSRGDALAKRGHDAAGNENEGSHGRGSGNP